MQKLVFDFKLEPDLVEREIVSYWSQAPGLGEKERKENKSSIRTQVVQTGIEPFRN